MGQKKNVDMTMNEVEVKVVKASTGTTQENRAEKKTTKKAV